MTKLPQFLRSRLALQQTALGGHPSANTLAAFAEQTLPGRARAGLLEHLARCPECRELLAAASAPEAGKVPGIAWWKWRWAAAAAAACVVAALLWRPGSFESSLAEKTLPAPSAPSAPKREEPPKVEVAKPRILSPRRTPVHPKLPAANAGAMPTLPQTATLPPLKLNLTLPEPPPAIAETTSLKIREANNELAELSGRAQSEKPQQNRTGVMEPNRIFQFGVRASAAKSRARPTLRPDGEKSLWILNKDLRKSDDGGRTWRVVQVDDRARLYALAADGSDVWVGGADGALFNSVDGGLNWKPIVVAGADARLTETITRIEARDENRVKLKTRSGDWLTTDGGLHWQRE